MENGTGAAISFTLGDGIIFSICPVQPTEVKEEYHWQMVPNCSALAIKVAGTLLDKLSVNTSTASKLATGEKF